MNQINLEWKKVNEKLWVGGSYFMRGHSMREAPGTSDWSFQEMYDIMFEIGDKAINYYLNKYSK